MSATEPKANIPEKKTPADDIVQRIATLQSETSEALHGLRALIEQRALPEMPYSWNAFYFSPDGGKEQFTIRKTDAAEYVKAVSGLKKHLAEQGYKSAVKEVPEQAQPTTNGETVPTCAIHKTPMVKRSKDGRSWWSCNQKIEGTDQWCPYKPPK